MRHVKRRVPTAAALLTGLALAVSPAAALGQDAGGQQYSDPLAAVHKAAASTSTTKTTSTAPSATKTPPVDLSSTTTTTSTSTATTPVTSSSNLPRTGLDLGVLAAIAAVLLLAGVGLRLRTAGVRRS